MCSGPALNVEHISMVSCQKGPTRHAYAWQIGPFWQDTLDMGLPEMSCSMSGHTLMSQWELQEPHNNWETLIRSKDIIASQC